MNRSVLNRGGARTWCCAMLAGLALLSWAWPAAGGQKQAIQSIAVAVGGSSGEASVTPGGTVHIRGLSAVYMVLSGNPLTAGRLTVTGNFNGDLSMDGAGSGSGTFEIGTWDLSSGVPVFVASAAGGYFQTRWEVKGVLGGAGSLKGVGHGVAGEAEGMTFVFEGETNVWDSELQTYVTKYTGWLLDPKSEK
jgi:hypothetical protein